MSQPKLPTYRTLASVMEKKNGSGVRLVGWTLARTVLIAPPMMLVGVDGKRAFAGAALASGLITLFAYLRMYNAGSGLGSARRASTAYRPRPRRRLRAA